MIPHTSPDKDPCHYREKCSKCHDRGVLLKMSDNFFFVKCRRCGLASRHGKDKDIAIENWNDKQQKLKLD